MNIKPLLEALADLETACRDAVDCMNVLALAHCAPEDRSLERLQDLYGVDGKSGYRKSVHQLIGIVGHCLNPGGGPRNHRVEVLKDLRDDGDGEITVLTEPYFEGTKPHEIVAESSAAAFLILIDQSKTSLNEAIAKSSGFNVEAVMSEYAGKSLVNNAWSRLRENWDLIIEEFAVPKGLDLGGLRDSISEEINLAKHLLTFGTPFNQIAAKAGSEAPQATPKQERHGGSQQPAKPAKTRKRDLCIPALLEHHRYDRNCELALKPVGVRELAKRLTISNSTVNAFFNAKFESKKAAKNGYANYKIACSDPGTLEHALKLLSGDVPPSILFQNLGRRAAKLKADAPEKSDD